MGHLARARGALGLDHLGPVRVHLAAFERDYAAALPEGGWAG